MKLLRAKEVAARRGRSIAVLYKDIREGRFPRGVKITNGITVWKEEDVDRVIEAEYNQAAEKSTTGRQCG